MGAFSCSSFTISWSLQLIMLSSDVLVSIEGVFLLHKPQHSSWICFSTFLTTRDWSSLEFQTALTTLSLVPHTMFLIIAASVASLTSLLIVFDGNLTFTLTEIQILCYSFRSLFFLKLQSDGSNDMFICQAKESMLAFYKTITVGLHHLFCNPPHKIDF